MKDEEAINTAIQKKNINTAEQVAKARNNIADSNIDNTGSSIDDNSNIVKGAQQPKHTKKLNEYSKQNTLNSADKLASHSGLPSSSTNNGRNKNLIDKSNNGQVPNKIGGPASNALRKSGLKGKPAQKALSKSGGGIANRISEASAKRKNNLFGLSSPMTNYGKGSLLGTAQTPFTSSDSLSDTKDEFEDNNSSEGLSNFNISKKTIIKVATIIVPSFLSVILVVVLIISSQTYLTASKLGQADSVIDDNASDNIEKIFDSDDINEEQEDVSYIYDMYIKESGTSFNKFEFAAKKESEIDSEDFMNDRAKILSELEEFYPDIVKYNSKEYNQNDVYKFFIKLYNVYHYYYGKGVRLDMPLLMSVLNLQSTEMEEVFKLNTVGYDKEAIDKGTNNPDFDINKDWSNYKSTRNNSAHDIEVLAQAMVKEGSSASETQDGNYVGDIEFMTGGVGNIYYFNQLDYPDEPYSSYGTIASHGCGPTSLSIVVSSLLKEVHDPIELTNKVCSIGGCFNEGSSWDSITQTPPLYGLQVSRTTNTQEVISALGTGKSLVIAIMCPGHFTSGGHFIVLTATNSNGEVTVADPASRERSTNWDFNIVAEENCGAYWIVNK